MPIDLDPFSDWHSGADRAPASRLPASRPTASNLVPAHGMAPASLVAPDFLDAPMAPETPVPEDIDDCDGLPVEIIRNPKQVGHILRQAAHSRTPVTLNSRHLGTGQSSRLLDVDLETRRLAIRQLYDDHAHEALLGDSRFNALVRQAGAPVLLSLTLSQTGRHHGQSCYFAALPAVAIWSQMRAGFRVGIDPGERFTLRCRFADGDSLETHVADISEGGVGLTIPHRPLRGLHPREHLREAQLTGGRTAIGPLDLEVRHIRSEMNCQRIGLAIRNASEGQRQNLRRLMLRLQATRH